MTQDALMGTYRRSPLALVRGRGVWVEADDGREFLDFVGGIAVNVLGHAHPAVVAALADQAGRLIHVSNLYTAPLQEAAAAALVATAFPGSVFFCNSGTEANEAAIKIARKWGRLNRDGATTIICLTGGFHGRTLGALAATAEPRYREPFEPLPRGFVHVPFNDLGAVAAAIDSTTAAILAEPIQGESGVVPMDDDVMCGLRSLCDDNNLLLMFDEIQTGMGRTGAWWAHQHVNAVPDVMTVAKGLGGGMPIGAVIANSRADVLTPGDHGSTFGGNALASRVAGAVLETITREGLVANAAAVGAVLRGALEALGPDAGIAQVRGRGLMLGVVLTDPIAAAVAARCADEGVLVIPVGDSVLRLLPALILTAAEAQLGAERIGAALRHVRSEEGVHA